MFRLFKPNAMRNAVTLGLATFAVYQCARKISDYRYKISLIKTVIRCPTNEEVEAALKLPDKTVERVMQNIDRVRINFKINAPKKEMKKLEQDLSKSKWEPLHWWVNEPGIEPYLNFYTKDNWESSLDNQRRNYFCPLKDYYEDNVIWYRLSHLSPKYFPLFDDALPLLNDITLSKRIVDSIKATDGKTYIFIPLTEPREQAKKILEENGFSCNIVYHHTVPHSAIEIDKNTGKFNDFIYNQNNVNRKIDDTLPNLNENIRNIIKKY